MRRSVPRTSREGVSVASRRVRDGAGFTLIELVIAITILPLIIGGLAIALIAMFSLSTSTAGTLSNSADAQVVSANFTQDVRAALQLTTLPTPTCGTGTQVLGLEWNYSNSTNAYQGVVSYVIVPSGSLYELVRQYCSSGASSTPTSVFTVAYDVTNSQAVATVLPTSLDAAAAAGWISTQNVTGVSFGLDTTQTGYHYTVVATPASSGPPNLAGSPTFQNTTTTCGFATPGTGTYASTLCFVNFAPLIATINGQTNPLYTLASTTGVSVSVSVPGGYTMTFVISVTGSAWNPHSFPTWTNSFLGNCIDLSTGLEASCAPNGTGTPFYTGVPGMPAVYQTANGGTNTVTLSNIKVYNPQGLPATGWQAVVADAETTDPSEYITFTSDQPLTVIPNDPANPSQPYGNDCNYGAPLTWSGQTTATCAGPSSGSSYPKTGTVMLGANAPTTMIMTMHGAGLEGVAFGLMLPGGA